MIVLIIFLVSLAHFSTDIYLPSLPAISDYFGVARSTVQLTVSLYLISMSFSPLIFGPLSDALGRKKIILFGLCFATIAALTCSLAPNIYFLLVGRTLQGIAIGAILVSGRAMVADLYSGLQLAKRITQVTMMMPFVLAIAPTIGGYIQEYFQWRAVFTVLIVYLGVLLIIVPRVPETVITKLPVNFSWKNPLAFINCYKQLINNAPFMLYGMYSVIPISAIFAYLTLSPFLFQNVLGLSPSEYGKLSLCIGISILLSGYINTKLLKILPLDKLLFIGAGIVVTAGCLLLLVNCFNLQSVTFILLPILLFYFCNTIGISNATSKALSYLNGSFGTARALLAALQFLAGALGSFIFSIIPIEDSKYLAICFIGNGILMLACVIVARRVVKKLYTNNEVALEPINA